MSTKENGCARRRHVCLPSARPFSLSPTTSKRLLRRPAKVVADSFHNLVYRAATKTCYEDKLLFRNVYFVATGEKCRKLALKSCIIKSIILPTQHNFEHKTSVSWATRSIICQILLKTEVLTVSKLTKMLVNSRRFSIKSTFKSQTLGWLLQFISILKVFVKVQKQYWAGSIHTAVEKISTPEYWWN